ncbi:MAG: hypothetical protein ACI9UN_005482 [Granulosicoccus sp.]|jgi:hypothetical protein
MNEIEQAVFSLDQKDVPLSNLTDLLYVVILIDQPILIFLLKCGKQFRNHTCLLRRTLATLCVSNTRTCSMLLWNVFYGISDTLFFEIKEHQLCDALF